MMDISEYEIKALMCLGGHYPEDERGLTTTEFSGACEVLEEHGLIVRQMELTDEGKAMLDRLDRQTNPEPEPEPDNKGQ